MKVFIHRWRVYLITYDSVTKHKTFCLEIADWSSN